ncbi:Protein tyrosine kinase [Teratosphaeria destructans]|uniref:Protein tyrosine kinase n=1 Tax=Teratosphaeria destructans TaxID=418781 RepID=A0A9W7SM47_9PEZI|nr:Protein tyrosine kinase [Teratosphaeria destructans]
MTRITQQSAVSAVPSATEQRSASIQAWLAAAEEEVNILEESHSDFQPILPGAFVDEPMDLGSTLLQVDSAFVEPEETPLDSGDGQDSDDDLPFEVRRDDSDSADTHSLPEVFDVVRDMSTDEEDLAPLPEPIVRTPVTKESFHYLDCLPEVEEEVVSDTPIPVVTNDADIALPFSASDIESDPPPPYQDQEPLSQGGDHELEHDGIRIISHESDGIRTISHDFEEKLGSLAEPVTPQVGAAEEHIDRDTPAKANKAHMQGADGDVRANHKKKSSARVPPKPKMPLRKKPLALTAGNLGKIPNAENAKPKPETPPSAQTASKFDAIDYIEKAWAKMEATETIATSVISERDKKIVRGAGTPYMDKTYKYLEYFCQQGKAAAVRELLKSGCNPGTRSSPRPEPLVRAIQGRSLRHDKCVRALTRKGCDINVKYRGTNPLQMVLEGPWFVGYAKLLGVLLVNGADANIPDGKGSYPLLTLLSGNANEVLDDKVLDAFSLFLHPKVPVSVDVNVRQRETLNTALHLAVRRTSPPIVALLISHGANVNALNSSGISPLLMAANQWRATLTTEQRLVLEFLLEAPEIDVDAVGGSLRRSALHQAVSARCTAAVEMLARRGASREVKDTHGATVSETLKGLREGMESGAFEALRLALEDDGTAKDRT